MAEFQAIILAGGSGIRMYPLTEETPKSLLPANGKPLLWYQLNLLETSGFSECLVVTVADMMPQIQDYIQREYDGKIHVDLCQVEDNSETADALREVADKIKKDFIVIAGDLITDVVVQNVADFHRINDASMTMLLKYEQKPDKTKGEKPRRDKDMIDAIGIDGKQQRVVMIHQAVHMNEDIYISKPLMQRCPNFTMHTDLYDPHFYIFSHWVLDLLLEKKYLASIKADVVPHLIRRQFRHGSSTKPAIPETIVPKAEHKQALAMQLSVGTKSFDANDIVRCFAYILPTNAYCERADTIAAYKAMENEVQSQLRVTRSASTSA